MPRPITLTTDALFKALNTIAQTPAQLAEKLGVSRATVHRKLKELADEQLLVKAGSGPQAGYRLPTTQEELARGRAETAQPGLVRVEMSRKLAGLVQSALECSARLGVGQFGQLEEQIRMGDQRRGDGSKISLDVCEDLRDVVAALQRVLMDYPTNASHGIFSPKVHPNVLQMWQLGKALRHRMAWDWRSEGSMGVWHDEPIVEGPARNFEVFSERVGDTHRYLVEMSAERAELVLFACNALVQCSRGDLSFLLSWAQTGLLRNREGEVPSNDAIAAALLFVDDFASKLSGGLGPVQSALADELESFVHKLQLFVAQCASGKSVPAQCFEEPSGAVRFALADSSPFAVALTEMPEGMMLNFHKGQYRVIGPSRLDGMLAIVGTSYSIQTAVAMATNYANKKAVRDHEF